MHQGLYLGFSGLRALNMPELHALWHEPSVNTTLFVDAVNASIPSTGLFSLFNLGKQFAAAARDVQYAASHPNVSAQADNSRQSLRATRQWQFIQANAASVLYPAYVRSLNYMVRAVCMGCTAQLCVCVC
jgi:hypothetical protein